MTPSLEKQWIARVILDGDHDAFKALVRAYQSPVRNFLRRLVKGDDTLADDLAQETFIQVYRNLEKYRGEAKLSTWMMKIAFNQFLQYQRKNKAFSNHQEITDDTLESGPQRDPNLTVDMEKAIQQLSDPERAAITLCFHQDVSHEEAAIILAMPLGTLKSHVARAKEKLKLSLVTWRNHP